MISAGRLFGSLFIGVITLICGVLMLTKDFAVQADIKKDFMYLEGTVEGFRDERIQYRNVSSPMGYFVIDGKDYTCSSIYTLKRIDERFEGEPSYTEGNKVKIWLKRQGGDKPNEIYAMETVKGMVLPLENESLQYKRRGRPAYGFTILGAFLIVVGFRAGMGLGPVEE